MMSFYYADGACEGRYGCLRGPIWLHMRAVIGSCGRTVMGLASQAVSARITKHFVTIFSKACNNSISHWWFTDFGDVMY